MLLAKRLGETKMPGKKQSSRPHEITSITSNDSTAGRTFPVGSETMIQDEDGNRVENNDVLKNYFQVIPKDSRYTRLRSVITHELSQIWEPGEKHAPKYPSFGTAPKVNSQLYIVKDPCDPIFHYQESIFPGSRAEYQFARLPKEVRQTLPITDNNRRGTEEVTEKRYGKPHYNIEYNNKNSTSDKHRERDRGMNEKCFMPDKPQDKGVQVVRWQGSAHFLRGVEPTIEPKTPGPLFSHRGNLKTPEYTALPYSIKSETPEKPRAVYTREQPKRTYEDRDQRITERCLIGDKQLDKDVQGLYPCYPGLFRKIDHASGRLVDRDLHSQLSDYSRIKAPSEVYHHHSHPNAVLCDGIEKEEIVRGKRNLRTAFADVQALHARNQFDNPPEMSIGEEQMRRKIMKNQNTRKQYSKVDLHSFNDDKYNRPHLQRFVPTLVRGDPISVRGVTSIADMNNQEEDPWYTPGATDADYHHALYPKSIRRGSEYLADRIRRTWMIENAEREEILQNLKMKQFSFHELESPPDYVPNVPTPGPVSVESRSEKNKQLAKHDMRANRRKEYEDARINRPNRGFNVNMKI